MFREGSGRRKVCVQYMCVCEIWGSECECVWECVSVCGGECEYVCE